MSEARRCWAHLLVLVGRVQQHLLMHVQNEPYLCSKPPTWHWLAPPHPRNLSPTQSTHRCIPMYVCAPCMLHSVSYIYHSMAAYFDRDNVGLPGFAAYFKESRWARASSASRLGWAWPRRVCVTAHCGSTARPQRRLCRNTATVGAQARCTADPVLHPLP